MLKELTIALKALKESGVTHLKEVSIRDDSVFVLTREGKTVEIDIKGLEKEEAIQKVVNTFKE